MPDDDAADASSLTQTLAVPAPARLRLAQYELLRQVGAGAMGAVFQARDVDLERWVAIKLLHAEHGPDPDPLRIERFFREARSAAQLSHPNVAQIYQVGQHEGRPFIAMEWLDGLDLSAWVRQHGPMPWPEALMAIGDAAAALVAAHAAGLVHRDIKPSNLVRLRSGQVKVVDFGLARRAAADAELTATGTLVGTPAYLSPEQCMGGEATPLSDLYALGCTLVHLLTGTAPYEASHAMQVMHKHIYEPMPDPSLRVAGLPPSLLRLLQRATAKPPTQRHASAAELLAEVNALLDGLSLGGGIVRAPDPVNAAPPTVQLGASPATASLLAPVIELPTQQPGNLPQELSSFVGRRALLTQAWERFGQARLLSLVGPGGTGKTRLALRLARLAAARFADGAWWVDLAPLPAGQGVHAALAQVLGLREAEGQDLQAAIVEHVRGRRVLVVFDNCEHVLDATAALAARLLVVAPDLQILATSRQTLGVPGETAFSVQPMQLCEPGAPAAALIDNEAAQLFAARARALRESFVLDAGNAAAVAEICRRLDGIPLAIELAAARIHALTPAQIAQRLNDVFKLLTGGQRTLLPRQQTLRALVDWSYELLGPAQRRLFARLAVFQGDFDLAAAEGVLADDAVPTEDVLDLLGELVDRSLLVADEREGGMRYHLLQTLRQYAAERLPDDPGLAGLRQRHATYYAQAAAEVAERLDGAGIATAKADMARLLDNARAAFDTALAQGWMDPALQLATALVRHDFHRGMLAESVARSERLLALEPPPSATLVQLLKGAGTLALRQGRNDLARRWFERGQAIAGDLNDEALRGELLRHLGNLAYRAGDYDTALQHYEQALASARSSNQTAAQAHARVNLAAVATEQARPAQAREHLLQALQIYKAAGNLRAQASLLGNLGVIDHDLGWTEQSQTHFREAIERHEAIAETRGAAMARCQWGACLIAQGDAAAAQAVIEAAVEALRPLDDRPTLAAALDWLARALFHQQQHERALALAHESLALRRAAASHHDEADSLDLFAELCQHSAPTRAARLLGAAAELRHRLGVRLQARAAKESDQLARGLRARLGDELFDQSFAIGRSTGPEAILQEP